MMSTIMTSLCCKGIGIPYGIYETHANRGCVLLGTSHETSAFTVSRLRKWWHTEGHKRYPQSGDILMLADTGGSNGAQRGAWKQEIQRQLCDGPGLIVTISHYPSGASKGIPSSTACSARSAGTGQPNL